jgi:zinc D-Ala-D-Ala dipeptidase
MFHKLKLNDQSYINTFTAEERSHYYLNRDLYNAKNQYLWDNQKLVTLSSSDKLKIEPFWQDADVVVADTRLAAILGLEGRLMREYVQSHPNFGVEVREKVATLLEKTAKNLPDHYSLVLKIGYRPLSVQYQLFDEVYQYFSQQQPGISPAQLHQMTLEFVTHPDQNVPPHSTGAAVDLTLWDSRVQEYVDMGSAINYPGEESWTYYADTLNPTQITNRLYLTRLMLAAGFANLASEWWHYSYGDPRWAVFYNQDSLYDTYDRENPKR